MTKLSFGALSSVHNEVSGLVFVGAFDYYALNTVQRSDRLAGIDEHWIGYFSHTSESSDDTSYSYIQPLKKKFPKIRFSDPLILEISMKRL